MAQTGQAVTQNECWGGWCRDLYRIACFLRDTGYKADVEQCRKAFPGILTFDDFLHQTKWGERDRKFEDGFEY